MLKIVDFIKGKKRAASGDLDEEDQRESVSRRLPDEERGHKRSSDDNIDDSDRRESISRRLPDDDGRPEPSGAPVQHSPDEAGAIAKKSVTWNFKVEEF